MTTTIAERHNLQRGDLCEIVIDGWNGPRTHYGKYSFTRDGLPHFDKDDQIPLRFKPEKIRSVRKVTAQYVAGQFYVGQRIVIRKYGGEYGAVVDDIKRTRLVATFKLNSGKYRTQSFPAWAVTIPDPTTLY